MTQSLSLDETAATAQQQVPLAPGDHLHSGNAGVLVERTGQLRAACVPAGRRFVRDWCAALSEEHAGLVTAYVYEEAFGVQDRLHWWLHLPSFDAYEEFEARARAGDGRWAPAVPVAGQDAWERLFVDGSLRQAVLMPQSFGMYGTADQRPDTVVTVDGESLERFLVPTARHQTSLPDEQVLHSGNCGLLMHRTGELHYDLRAEGRQFARALAEGWNTSLAGHATIFLYEEVFGLSDRVHWLIHLRSLATYYHLMGLRARTDPAAREAFVKQWVAPEKGGGGWERLFVQGTLRDVALVPQRGEPAAAAADGPPAG